MMGMAMLQHRSPGSMTKHYNQAKQVEAAGRCQMTIHDLRERYSLAQRSNSRDEAFEIIRSLIDEIRLVPQDGALKIELRGELAGILALASESTKARGLSTSGLA